MVKRPKSPEIHEEARYFTVYQPYPMHANWIMEDDQRKCAMWVAECIGLNHLWAIHYKPKARGMILLEVAKTFTDHGRFLGEHRWSKILHNPNELEKTSVTQVFHSFYTKGREAQKDGWKAIPVPNSWFNGWSPGKGDIVRPYPRTYWCAVPVEDRTNKPLCRPLPSEQKAPPPLQRPKQQVPGSAQWVEKQVDPSITPPINNAWAKPIPSLDISKANNPRGTSPSINTPQSAISGNDNKTPTTATETEFPVPTTKNTRGKPMPLNEFISGPSKPKKSGWAKPQDINAKFSIKDPVVKAPMNAWSKKLNIPPSEKTVKSPPPTEDLDHSGWNLPDPPASPKPGSSLASPAPGETRSLQPDPTNPSKSSKKRDKAKAKSKDVEDAWNKLDANLNSALEEETNGEVLMPAPVPVFKPLTRADVDRVLRPWERGKVDYAAMGVVDAEPPSSTVKWDMDWTPQHVLDKAKDEGKDKGKGKDKEFENKKKRKPDGQFASNGQARYDADGNPDNKEDSRKRASPGPASEGSWGEQSHDQQEEEQQEQPKEEKKKRNRGRNRDPEWVAANPYGSGERRAPGKGLARAGKHGVVWYSGRKPEGEEGQSVEGGGGGDSAHVGMNDWASMPAPSQDVGMNDWASMPVPGEGEAGPSDWAAEPAAEQGKIDWSEEPVDEPPGSEDWAYEGEGEGAQKGESNDWASDPEESGEVDWTREPNDKTARKEWGTPEPASKPKPKKEVKLDWAGNPIEDDHAAWGVVPPGDPPAANQEEEVELDWAGNPIEDDYAAWGGVKPDKPAKEVKYDWAGNPIEDDYAAWGVDPDDLPARTYTETEWETAGDEPWRKKKVDELICPTHNIACKKGICRDMAKLIRERDMKQWERTRGRGKGHQNRGRGDPRGPRGTWGAKELEDGEVVTYKRTRRSKKKDPISIGVMRGFEDEVTTATESNHDNGDD